jgi:plastocyanin
MRFDITKLPIDVLVLGGLAVAIMATFLAAFTLTTGIEVGEEGGEGGGGTPVGPPQTEVTIRGLRGNVFDTDQLVVVANQDVTVHFDNQDAGIPHNFHLYRSPQAQESIAAGEVCMGPCSYDVTFNVPEGDYFYRCDIHPTTMTGTLLARPAQ